MNSTRVNRRLVWWRWAGLNGRPAAYESAALPTELHRHDEATKSADDSRRRGPVSTERIEKQVSNAGGGESKPVMVFPAISMRGACRMK
jgi:hypothetical protein